ncbi:MAG: hypothetical protein ACK5PS_11090 [Desulfopila sp.]
MRIKQAESAVLFVACVAAICWACLTDWLAAPLALPRLAVLFLLLGLVRIFFLRKIPAPTSSGAIVMAIGIFVNGAIAHFPVLNEKFGPSLALILFILLIFIASSYLADLLQKRLFSNHLASHLGRFAVGTWIAGISVCGIALCQRLPGWRPVVQLMVLGNLALWLLFIVWAIDSLRHFFLSDQWQQVHGVLLLSTVSSQSLVIAWKAAFGTSAAYRLVAPAMLGFGTLLYILSLALICRRYLHQGRSIDLDRDWYNTNCIIHGAMSITGLASAVSGVIPDNITLLVWLWVILWFLLVESVELARALLRLRRYGFSEGLCRYDPSQWSRNFTFGMLYAFTGTFDITGSIGAGTVLVPLHQLILRYFAWVVLAMLLLEILLFLRARLSPAITGTSGRR